MATVDDNVIAGLVAMGAPDDVIAAARDQMVVTTDDPDVFQVWPENWPTWLHFLAVQRQWVYAGMNGQRVCLNSPGIESHFRMSRIPRTQQQTLWADFLVIQEAVLKVDFEQRDRK